MNDKSTNALEALAGALTAGNIETVDLTHTLDPDFPVIVLPPEFGQCARFRVEEVSRYDERGPAWYWRNFTCSEHTGTHFDATIHWISGKDLPDSSVDSIPADAFVRPVCVLDCSKESAGDDDFLLTPEFIRKWEKQYGVIPAGSWVLMRTDWSKRSGAEYLNMREDGAHTPGPYLRRYFDLLTGKSCANRHMSKLSALIVVGFDQKTISNMSNRSLRSFLRCLGGTDCSTLSSNTAAQKKHGAAP